MDDPLTSDPLLAPLPALAFTPSGTSPVHSQDRRTKMASNNPNDDDDKPLQDAIKASLQANSSNPPLKLEKEIATGSEVVEQLPPQRINIDDRIKDMAVRAAIELPLVHELGGDTWVFIDPPPMQPEQDLLDYARYIKRYEHPMLMKKDTLTKSSPVFARLFEPTVQFRIKRRRNLVKALGMEFNVKYVIDLTPLSEGEEAVYLMTELCCSEGVRLWYRASEIWKVASTLVGGEEEYTSVKSQRPIQPLATFAEANVDTDTETLAQQDLSSTPASLTSKLTRVTLEYSPVRHRSAIERVLNSLLGSDPKLDSAPKVWTTFAVAKYYGIKHSRLDDYIISWLRAYPNSYFLEVLPEVSLQIAEGLENYELARDTFAILVGEEALDNLRRARNPSINNKLTTYGRKKEDLPEHIHTRVEYASKSFLERITNDFMEFTEDMLWMENLPECRRLALHTQPELQKDIEDLKLLLKDYVRGTIYKLLCVNYDHVPPQDLHHPGGKDLLPRVSRSDVWIDNLSMNERILSRTFWEALKSFSLFRGRTNLETKEGWGQIWDTPKLSSFEKLEMGRGTYREVQTLVLKNLIWAGTRWLEENAPPASFPLPIRSLPGAGLPRAHLPGANVSFTEPNTQSPDLMQFNDDLIGAQITQPDLYTPTQPIEIRQPSRVPQAAFNPDPIFTPDNRAIVQDLSAQWPFGAPRQYPASNAKRQGSALDVLRNMNGSLMSTLDHQSMSELPAPEGFSSWTSCEALTDDKQVNEINIAQRPVPTGRSTSPFAKRMEEFEGNMENFEEMMPCSRDYSAQNPSKGIEEIDEVISVQQTESTGRLTPPFFGEDITLPSSALRKTGKREDPSSQLSSQPSVNKFFNLEEFFLQAEGYIVDFARNKLHPADHSERPDPLEIGIANTLVCLQDSEWKYLPLWAGGNDDGSGGVFNDQVPIADLGFSTAGPDVHDGTTPAGSTASSEFDMVSTHSGAASTFNTSMANNRGFSDHMHRGRVYATDSTDAASSHQDDDSYTVVTDDDEEDYARRQMEAQERIEAAEELAANEARRTQIGRGRMEDENYADLFNSEDDEGDETDRAEVGDFDEDEMDESDDGIEDLVVV